MEVASFMPAELFEFLPECLKLILCYFVLGFSGLKEAYARDFPDPLRTRRKRPCRRRAAAE